MEVSDFSFIYKYFTDEKHESLLFLFIGIAAFILSVVFFFYIKTSPSFFKGAAIPLFLIGIIQIVLGFNVYTKADKQKSDLAYIAGTDPQFVKNSELPRMEKVMKNFVIYRYTEIVMAIIGLGLFFYFRNFASGEYWKGLGMTLAIQAILMLGADYSATQRAKIYFRGLNRFMQHG